MVIVVLNPLNPHSLVILIGALFAVTLVQVFLKVNLSQKALRRGRTPLVVEARTLSGPVLQVIDLPIQSALFHSSLEFHREHSPSKFHASAFSVPFVAG